MRKLPFDKREWSASIGILVLALLFQLYFIKQLWGLHINLYGDSIHYDHAAVVLLLMHVYTYWSWGPSAQVTPGYPLFLEFSYWLTLIKTHNHQVQMHVAATFQHLMVAVSVFGLYRVARYVLPIWASLVAAILWMIYPPATWAADQLLTESLYTLLLVLFAWSFLFALKKGRLWRYILAGFVLGLTTLVRPSVMPLVAAPLLLLLQRQDWRAIRSHLLHFAGYLAMFIICMLPWWIRNVRVMHHFILTDEDVGNPLLFGSDPNFAHDPNLGSGLSASGQKALAIHRIIEGFTHHPFAYLKWYTIDKLHLLFGAPWYLDSVGKHASAVNKLTFYYAQTHLVWVILGAVGLLLGFWRPYMRFVSGLALFLIVVQLPFIPMNRYVFPVMPLFFVGVMFLVFVVVKWIQQNRQTVTNQ